jgi:hypothetical protein
MRREGFWKDGPDSTLPIPKAYAKAWRGQAEFLKQLAMLEANDGIATIYYRGWSTCRLCKDHVGNKEYEHKGWVWPEGFEHYVAVHNVRPSLAFQELILGKEVK